MDFLSDQSCYAFYPIPNTGVEQHLWLFPLGWSGEGTSHPSLTSRKGPAGSPSPCFPAQNQLELSCSVQTTQGILHQTRASNAGPKISASGLFLIVPVFIT